MKIFNLKKKSKSILFKTVTLLWSTIIISILIFLSVIIPYQKKTLLVMLESEAQTIVSSISQITATAIISEDFSFVVDHCMNVIKERQAIKYVVITRKDGFSLIHTPHKWSDKILNGMWMPLDLANGVIIKSEIVNDRVFHFSSKFNYSGIDWGWIHIGLSIDKFNADFKATYKRTIIVAIICIFCGLIISYIFSRRLSKSIQELHLIIQQVTGGDLTVKAEISTDDEIQNLAESFNNMTETLKNSQKKLIIANEYSYNILKSMNDTLFVMSAGGIIQTVNSALTKLLNYDECDIVGQPASKIIATQSYFDNSAMTKLHEIGFLSNIEKNYLTKTGREIPMLFSATVMRDKNNDIQGIVCVAFDLTMRKKMEDQINRNADEIKTYAEKITNAYNILKETQEQLIQSEKMASVGSLAAGIAHEINNPMAYIKWNINAMKKYQKQLSDFLLLLEIENNYNPNIETIKNSIQKFNIKFMINDIDAILTETLEGVEKVLDITKNLKLIVHPGNDIKNNCEINSLIKNILNFIINEYKYKIKIITDFGNIPLISGHSQQLIQVFMNLLVNAADSIQDNGTIIIKTYTEDAKLIIKISDNGIGIPENIKHKIFDPFFTTKEIGKGTGLGLNIVYKIIKKHNGNIYIDSVVNRGSTFTIELPV